MFRHSTIQFFETQADYEKNARPQDIFLLRDGLICKRDVKRLLDGRVEHKIVIVTQKSNGVVETHAEFASTEAPKGCEIIEHFFLTILKVLSMLRMVRLEPGGQLPIPKMECHGFVL